MRMEVQFPSEAIAQMEKMGELDRVAPIMLKKASKPVKNSLQRFAEVHTRTGEMARSVRAQAPKKNKYGGWGSRVNFSGYDRNREPTPGYPRGVPNAVKAAAIEYGNRNQRASPFVQAAADAAQDEAVSIMQKTYEEECCQ